MKMPLNDLEEMVLKCRSKRAASFIREAVESYKSGAYRASIVACWIAVCHDLIEKIRELALAGDGQAEVLVQKIENIQKSNDVRGALAFEKEILTHAREKFELLTENEFVDLSRLQSDRNRCAHPTLTAEGEEYLPPAELARVHLYSAVHNLLMHEPAQGRFALERLVAQVSSDYFPKKSEEVLLTFRGGALARARTSLVRNFVVVLLKFVFKEPDYQKHRNYLNSLKAIEQIHRRIYSEVLGEKMSGFVESADDEAMRLISRSIIEIPQAWDFLSEPDKIKVRNFVQDLPSSDFLFLDEYLAFKPLEKSILIRIEKASLREIADSLFFTVPHPVADRIIQLYLASCSFDYANSAAKELCLIASDLTEQHVRDILSGAGKNSQITGSFELKTVVKVLWKRKIIPQKEFEDLAKAGGLGKVLESIQFDELLE